MDAMPPSQSHEEETGSRSLSLVHFWSRGMGKNDRWSAGAIEVRTAAFLFLKPAHPCQHHAAVR